MAAAGDYDTPFQAQGSKLRTGKRAAAVEPTGSKRQRSPTGWKETVGGSDGGATILDTSQVAAALTGKGGGAPRRLWTKKRSSSWWEEVSSQWYPAHDFKHAFRMSQATFKMLCGELAVAIAKEDTALRNAIPVRKRVAVCVWRLASGEPLRQVSARFGIGISTCHKICLEVCAAITNLLMRKSVLWPDSPSAASAIAAKFKDAYGIPNVVGAIYTTHIPIIAPTFDAISYYNSRLTGRRKKWSFSITAQVVVDAGGSFTDICVGYPGSMSDEDVLRSSGLNTSLSGQIQAEGKWLLGGGSYPVTDWMLAPYCNKNLTQMQHLFNKKAAGVREVAKYAVMRLKARWKLLQKRSEMKVMDFPMTISACCVLHNICERNGDMLDTELAIDLVDDEMFAEKPVRSAAASLVRDGIATNLFIHANGVRNFRFE